MQRNMDTTGMPLKKEHGGKPAGQSHWVLMTTDVIPTSRGKPYAQQQELVRKYAHYQVPQTLEAATCILMEHVKEGKRLYSDDPCTYTRCQEQTAGYQNVVGGFGPSGLSVCTTATTTSTTSASVPFGSSKAIGTWILGTCIGFLVLGSWKIGLFSSYPVVIFGL